MYKIVTRLLTIALALVFLLTACAQATSTSTHTISAPTTNQPKTGGTLIVAVSEDMKGLDPHMPKAASTFLILGMLYDPLFTFDKDMNVIGNLAESWKFSDDAKALTIILRKGVKFHDGSSFTSLDVKASIERILDEKTGASARSSLSSITSIDTPDDFTVVLSLKAPNAALPTALTALGTSILSKTWLDSGKDPAKEENGTGAFKLANWETDKVIHLVKNKDFWLAGKPYLDGIEFRIIPDESSIVAALRAKQVDFSVIGDPRIGLQISNDAELQVWKSATLNFNVLQLNADKDVFKDVRVRQAISCAIDRQEVLDTASLGDGKVTSPATAPFFAAPLDTLFCYKKDEVKAKSLLAEAGNPTVKFTAMVTTGESPVAVNQAQNIQAQLKKVGIEMEIETLELQIYVDRWLAGDFEAVIAYNGASPDADVTFYRYWNSTGNLNLVAGWRDPEMDKMLDEARAIPDPEQRKLLYYEIQKKLTEAAPWIWLYTGYNYQVGQTFVKGFTPLSDSSIMYLRETWLDK